MTPEDRHSFNATFKAPGANEKTFFIIIDADSTSARSFTGEDALYETKQTLDLEEVKSGLSLFSFNVLIDGKTFSSDAETGEVIIYPNKGNYTITVPNVTELDLTSKKEIEFVNDGELTLYSYARDLTFVDNETGMEITPLCEQDGFTFDSYPYWFHQSGSDITCSLTGYESVVLTANDLEHITVPDGHRAIVLNDMPDETAYRMIRYVSPIFTLYNEWTDAQYDSFSLNTSSGIILSTTDGTITFPILETESLMNITFTADGANPVTIEYDLEDTAPYKVYVHESLQTITVNEIKTRAAIDNFEVQIGNKSFNSDENGVVTFRPNMGTYPIRIESSNYFAHETDLVVNSVSGNDVFTLHARNITFTNFQSGEQIFPTCYQNTIRYNSPYLMHKSNSDISCSLAGYEDITISMSDYLATMPDNDTYTMVKLNTIGFSLYNKWTNEKYDSFTVTSSLGKTYNTTNGAVIIELERAKTGLINLTFRAPGIVTFTEEFDLSKGISR